MSYFLLLLLVAATFESSAVNKKFVEHLKKVAPFEVYEPEENRFKEMTDEEIKMMFGYYHDKSEESALPTKKIGGKFLKDEWDDEYDFRKAHPEYVYDVYEQGKCDAA